MFDSIYFLHIPKTGGRALGPITSNINDLKGCIKKHVGWPTLEDSTYLICSWREPAARTISHFAFVQPREEYEPSLDGFFKWFHDNKEFLINYQSRNLLFEPKDISAIIHKQLLLANSEFMKIIFNEKLVRERTKRINLFLKCESDKPWALDKIGQKIYDDLGLGKWQWHNTDENSNYYSQLSNNLYKELTNDQIKYLNETSTLDYEIYNSKIFWEYR